MSVYRLQEFFMDRTKTLPRLILIAAASRNGVLAVAGKIPWHLPADVAHFRARTAGHWLLLGRTTYEQMSGWFRPGQVPVVLTRQKDYAVPDGWAVVDLEAALALAEAHQAGELLVCGGGKVYAATLPFADEVILTVVDLEVSGDTFFPAMEMAEWELVKQEDFPAGGAELPVMSIRRYVRRGRAAD